MKCKNIYEMTCEGCEKQITIGIVYWDSVAVCHIDGGLCPCCGGDMKIHKIILSKSDE